MVFSIFFLGSKKSNSSRCSDHSRERLPCSVLPKSLLVAAGQHNKRVLWDTDLQSIQNHNKFNSSLIYSKFFMVKILHLSFHPCAKVGNDSLQEPIDYQQ